MINIKLSGHLYEIPFAFEKEEDKPLQIKIYNGLMLNAEESLNGITEYDLIKVIADAVGSKLFGRGAQQYKEALDAVILAGEKIKEAYMKTKEIADDLNSNNIKNNLA